MPRGQVITPKQAATIKDVLENKMPISVAMRKNGYSEESSRSLKIKESNAWQKAVAQYLPDHKILKAHHEALEANKLHTTGDDFVEIPDHMTRLKAVDLAYKVKGYTSEKVRGNNTQVNISFDGSGYVPPDNTLGITPTNTKKLTK